MESIVKLVSLKCVKHSSDFGNDDLYFKVFIDGADGAKIPVKPGLFHSWNINEGSVIHFQPSSQLQSGTVIQGTDLTFVCHSEVRIELWDYDLMGGDDLLGSALFKATDSSEEKHLQNAQEGDEYLLNCEITPTKSVSRRTLFISDIHMGINAKTNWYQSQIHGKALKGFLRYALQHANEINDVVILGDWFDQWTYSPTDTPPTVTQILDNNPDVFLKQADGSGDFISVMEAIGGKLRFVNGNHDLLVELQEINQWFSRHTEQRVYPGVGDDIAKRACDNTYFQNDNGKIYAEHGHLYDLFNKPALMSQNPYTPLPVGHFITRTVGAYVLKQLQNRPNCPNCAYLKESGDPSYANYGLDIKVISDAIGDVIDHKKPNIAEIALDLVLSFDQSKQLDYNMQWYHGGSPSSSAIDHYYPGLFSFHDFCRDLHEAEVNFEGLEYFAKQLFDKPHRVIVMGHTHDYKLVWKGHEKDPVYINSGFFCAPLPDDKPLTFVEVIEHEPVDLTINEKQITDYKTGEVTQGQSALIKWAAD